jgi:uncharacterized protein (TIGR03067 family)
MTLIPLHVWCRLSVIVFGTLALAGDDSAAEVKAKELKKFQGTWILLSGEKGGEQIPADKIKSVKLVFKDNKIKVAHSGKKDHVEEFDIDPEKSPKEINVTRELNGQKSTVVGIYSFDGKTLKLCVDDFGKERPTEFSTKDKPSYTLLVLKRE